MNVMNINYKNTITVEEINAIRKSIGWRQQHPDQLQEQLDSVDLIIAAYAEDTAVGVAIGQGYILIMPEYQYQGIENEFMKRIIDHTRSKLKPGYGTQIDIRAFGDKQIALYESLGFQISTAEQRGVPMHICVTNQIELTDKMFKQREFKEDTKIYSDIQIKEPILKGWSEDKKYCVTVSDGTKYLLRITPISRYETRKTLFAVMKQVAALDIPMCVPIEFGTCDDGVYSIQSWINGEDLNAVLPRLSEAEQYTIGYKSGEILRKMHTIPAPDTQEEWESRFNKKTNRRINTYIEYREQGLTAGNEEDFLSYVQNNRHLLKNRPQCFQHGDYHVGNMMVKNGELIIIDFDRYDFGDPWDEFNRITFTAHASPYFATGQLRGYFNGEPLKEFFKLLAFYIASNQLGAVGWAQSFGQSEVDFARKQNEEVLQWFDNMNNPMPTWYLKGVAK